MKRLPNNREALDAIPGPFNCHPERSEGSKVLAFLGVLLSKHF